MGSGLATWCLLRKVSWERRPALPPSPVVSGPQPPPAGPLALNGPDAGSGVATSCSNSKIPSSSKPADHRVTHSAAPSLCLQSQQGPPSVATSPARDSPAPSSPSGHARVPPSSSTLVQPHFRAGPCRVPCCHCRAALSAWAPSSFGPCRGKAQLSPCSNSFSPPSPGRRPWPGTAFRSGLPRLASRQPGPLLVPEGLTSLPRSSLGQ